MSSQLTISCNSCFAHLKNKRGYTIDNTGLLSVSFPVSVAYTNDSLYELFAENHTCPFCRETLTFSPTMMGFANDYIDKKYHIVFEVDHIKIINDWETISINKNIALEEVPRIFDPRNNDLTPSSEEMKEILFVSDDVDSSKWKFCIQSKYTTPYFDKVKPNYEKEDFD